MTDRLPIYRLGSEGTDVPRLIGLGQSIFEINQDFRLSENGASRTLRSGQRMVEIAATSGGVWAADEAQLWNPTIRPDLPQKTDAIATANKLAYDRKLLPKLEGKF